MLPNNFVGEQVLPLLPLFPRLWAKPSVMTASRVQRNSGPILPNLWTKIHLLMSQFLRRYSSLQCGFPIDDNMLHCEYLGTSMPNTNPRTYKRYSVSVTDLKGWMYNVAILPNTSVCVVSSSKDNLV